MTRAPLSILDVTLRDGSYPLHYQFTTEHVTAIVTALDTAGIPFIELGHGCGLGARENMGFPAAASDIEYAQAARRATQRAKLGVLVSPPPFTQRQDIATIRPYLDFIRVATNANDPTPVAEHLAYARSLGLDVWFQMVRSSRCSPAQLLATAKQVEAMGASTVYVVDTAGSYLPEQVSEIIALLKSHLSIKVGYHAHNNLGLAIANTLAAVAAGADRVDASLRGLGRGAGNTQLEALVVLLQRQGLATEIAIDPLLTGAQEIIEPLMPPQRGIAGVELLTGAANIDLYPLPLYERLASLLAIPLAELIRFFGTCDGMMDIGLPQLEAAIRHFGSDAAAVLQELGIARSA